PLRAPRLDRLLRHRVLLRQLLDRRLPGEQGAHRLQAVARTPPPRASPLLLRLCSLLRLRHASSIQPQLRGDFPRSRLSASGRATEYRCGDMARRRGTRCMCLLTSTSGSLFVLGLTLACLGCAPATPATPATPARATPSTAGPPPARSA